MKKYLILCFALLIICAPAFASGLKKMPYQNIKDGNGVKYTEAGIWTNEVRKKDSARLVRNGSLLNSAGGANSYDTECSYLFIKDGKLFGYSPLYTKFYELMLSDSNLCKRELETSEVRELFDKFKVIKTSSFSEYTNAYKYTKDRKNTRVIILNDTQEALCNYGFSTYNAKISRYIINNAIKIRRVGMIQFSPSEDETKSLPWFILLVR